MGNLVISNPTEQNDTVAALVTAVLLDEAAASTTNGNLATTNANVAANTASIVALQGRSAYALYTVAGAITPTGNAVLKTGTAGHMTLVNPAADNISLKIVAADAQAYLVTCNTGKLNGLSVGTFGGAIGDSLVLLSSGGVWLALVANGVTIA